MPSELPGEPPMDPEILGLLERERSDPFAEGGGLRRAAMAKRLQHAAVAMAAVGAASVTGAAADAARAALQDGLEGQAKRLVSWGLASKIGVASLLFAAGGVAGGWWTAHRAGDLAPSSSRSSSAVVAGPTESSPLSSTKPDETAPPSDVPTVSVDSLPRAAAGLGSHAALQPLPSASAAPSATSLGEEQRLLDMARAAVARQAYSAALATLGEHATRFPRGRLAEERELLYVQALAGSGNTAQASERAKAFERQFPGSIFLPAVKAATPSK
jgi:hypothetical protein